MQLSQETVVCTAVQTVLLDALETSRQDDRAPE